MKKISCIIAFVVFLYQTVVSQGITFSSNKTWASIVQQAKKENKFIFLDAYAAWCGPCKYLQQKVFTDKAVGVKFNKNFINAKIDMEKGEGIALAQKFKVGAYPTLLFFNSNGQLIHKYVGAMEVEEFLAMGDNALSPEKQFYTLMAKAKSGKLTPKSFGDWLVMAEKMEEDGTNDVISLYLQNSGLFLNKDVLLALLDYGGVLKEKELIIFKENKAKIVELTRLTSDGFDEALLGKVKDYANKKSVVEDNINYDTYRSIIFKYFPNKAEAETKKLKTLVQLKEGSIDFNQLLESNDEEILDMSVRVYFGAASKAKTTADQKSFLNKSKQLSYKLITVAKPDVANRYKNYIVLINEAINEIEPTNYFGRIERIKENISTREKLVSTSSLDSLAVNSALSRDYGSLAWYQLFTKDYLGTIQSAEKGLQLNSENDWIVTNLALGYLLSKNFEKAEELYLKYKEKKYSDDSKSFKEAFLGDFAKLEDEGVISPNEGDIYKKVAEIKAKLK